jgi:hypothetical protein
LYAAIDNLGSYHATTTLRQWRAGEELEKYHKRHHICSNSGCGRETDFPVDHGWVWGLPGVGGPCNVLLPRRGVVRLVERRVLPGPDCIVSWVVALCTTAAIITVITVDSNQNALEWILFACRLVHCDKYAHHRVRTQAVGSHLEPGEFGSRKHLQPHHKAQPLPQEVFTSEFRRRN